MKTIKSKVPAVIGMLGFVFSGGKGMYCSGNPITAGRIIEKQTHHSLPEFAKQRLFTPLGITQFDWQFQPDSSSAETYCQLSLRPRIWQSLAFYI